MKALIEFNHQNYQCDLTKGIDISIPIEAGENHVSAWYVPPVEMEPVRMGDWVGSVEAGASVNFRNIYFNPHGHGTHTESYGHISKEIYSVNEVFDKSFFVAQLITVQPEQQGDDFVITNSMIESHLKEGIEAVIIRTLPNGRDKQTKNYSNTNPVYLHQEVALTLRNKNVKHLLIDGPSVDKEQDEGKLLAHHAFWNYPVAPRKDATITEFIYVKEEVADGLYLMNLQTAPFVNDATPSRPVLFLLTTV
jgi:kynurenine formamidase